MASDSEPKSGTADEQKAAAVAGPPGTAGEQPRKKKLKRAKRPIPQTEAEVDSPSKQTVGMLGILGLMTLVMWALARGGCNYHPPKETRVPRKVTTEDLARNPKDAAVELQQRLLTHNYSGALELATGDAAIFVEKDKAACDAACLSTRKALEQTVLTSAVILDQSPLGTTARVTSVLPRGSKTYLMRLLRADAVWKATELKPDTGVPLPFPSGEPPITPAAPFAPAPSSVAPASNSSDPARASKSASVAPSPPANVAPHASVAPVTPHASTVQPIATPAHTSIAPHAMVPAPPTPR